MLLIVLQGIAVALIGVFVGLVGSMAMMRTLTGLLYDVTPSDPTMFAGVVTMFLSVAAMACVIPARRATQVSAVQALRYD